MSDKLTGTQTEKNLEKALQGEALAHLKYQFYRSQLAKYNKGYEKQLDELKDILLDRSKVSEAEYNKHVKNSWWISADDAARLKICNEILNSHNIKK